MSSLEQNDRNEEGKDPPVSSTEVGEQPEASNEARLENTQESHAPPTEPQFQSEPDESVKENVGSEQHSPLRPSLNENPTTEISAPVEEEQTTAAESKDTVHGSEGPGKVSPSPNDPEKLAAATERLKVGDTSASLANAGPSDVPAPPPPPPKDDKFLNPDGTPLLVSPARSTFSEDARMERRPSDSYFNDKEFGADGSGEGNDNAESKSEIQNIMGQFDEGMGGKGMEEIMSPRMEFAGPALGSQGQHPPRRSSLVDPVAPGVSPTTPGGDSSPQASQRKVLTSPPPRTSSLQHSGQGESSEGNTDPEQSTNSPAKPASSIFKPPPLEPDPEPDLPFDFHRFLEQLRHRTADPVAKYLRSFLLEFGKKQWMVHEQVKIISDFLEFIAKKMAQCEVWQTVSDAEFDNAREGMEKLVMNRLYNQTFSPAIPPPEPLPARGSRKKAAQQQMGPGRRGQHQEDVERDDVLAQKVRIYGWVKEEHLDIKSVGDKGRKFLNLAQQELLKIKSYRAPRDKVICVLNCCKVIFGFLRNMDSDQSADSFVPLLIYTVLQANPEHLVSNVQYILRFRNQDKLGGEAGYYISSLMGAVQFIENLDRTSLTISDSDFEKNVEAAVSAIAERHSAEEQREQLHLRHPSPNPNRSMGVPEKSTPSRPEITPRNSLDAERSTPRRRQPRNGASASESEGEDNVTGLLRTIQKPLSTIGRIFSEDNAPQGLSQQSKPGPPAMTPQPGSTPRRMSPVPPGQPQQQQRSSGEQARQMNAEDAAARQASAEAEEARRIQRQEHKVVVETLQGMFPNLDRDVIDDVVRQKEGRVGLAVDACLALSN